MSLILIIINILIGYMLLPYVTAGMISNDIVLFRDDEVASLSTCCNIPLVFSLSTCREFIGFTIEASLILYLG